MPEAVASKLAPPTIESKPLTEFTDRRLELLVSLLSAKRRGIFTAPKEIFDTDPQRFRLMESRFNKALAAASGASVTLGFRKLSARAGEEAQLAVILSNAGVAEIQIKQR